MNPKQHLPGKAPLAANLIRLIALRWFIITGSMALLLLANTGFELISHSVIAWLVLVAYAGMNTAMSWWLRTRQDIKEWFFIANLALDLLLIWLFLQYSGGSANPFTLLFLLPVIVAAATLPSAAIWLVTGMSIAAYTLLLWLTPQVHVQHNIQNGFDLHLQGMWLGLVFIAALVAYFVTGMGHALRERETQLAKVREQALRDERVIALGAMAAGAAHELGTPLASMMLLVDDLQADNSDQENSHRRLLLLKSQIQRCKQLLSSLSMHGNELHAKAGLAMTPAQLLDSLLRRWQLLRPDTAVKLCWKGSVPNVRILADETLFQSLSSLLNNAADASAETIQMIASLQGQDLIIEIEDRGPGISQGIARRIGRKPVSSKADQHGLGIGLLLASSVIERLGGEVAHRPGNNGGTVASVRLPLEQLLVENSLDGDLD